MPDTVEIRTLDPHDPLPDGQAGRVIVLRRFDEDDPRKIVTEITLTGPPGHSEAVHPVRADGTAMSLDEAVSAAQKVAESEGIGHTAGLRGSTSYHGGIKAHDPGGSRGCLLTATKRT